MKKSKIVKVKSFYNYLTHNLPATKEFSIFGCHPTVHLCGQNPRLRIRILQYRADLYWSIIYVLNSPVGSYINVSLTCGLDCAKEYNIYITALWTVYSYIGFIGIEGE